MGSLKKSCANSTSSREKYVNLTVARKYTLKYECDVNIPLYDIMSTTKYCCSAWWFFLSKKIVSERGVAPFSCLPSLLELFASVADRNKDTASNRRACATARLATVFWKRVIFASSRARTAASGRSSTSTSRARVSTCRACAPAATANRSSSR